MRARWISISLFFILAFVFLYHKYAECGVHHIEQQQQQQQQRNEERIGEADERDVVDVVVVVIYFFCRYNAIWDKRFRNMYTQKNVYCEAMNAHKCRNLVSLCIDDEPLQMRYTNTVDGEQQ